MTEEHRKPDSKVSIFHLAEAIGTEVQSEDLLVSGSSGAALRFFFLRARRGAGQRIYHTAGLGAMGYGLPMSLAFASEVDAGGRFLSMEMEAFSSISRNWKQPRGCSCR